mmetsp:Transcript_24408/g.60997  ORF Transcript_24408/g.60997 Transcript_24408/m.60997 type:complete len:206 (-) Transcript_24408:294-911(-)
MLYLPFRLLHWRLTLLTCRFCALCWCNGAFLFISSSLLSTVRASNLDALACAEALFCPVCSNYEETFALLEGFMGAISEAHNWCCHLLEEVGMESGQVEKEEGVLGTDQHTLLAIALHPPDVRFQCVSVRERAAGDDNSRFVWAFLHLLLHLLVLRLSFGRRCAPDLIVQQDPSTCHLQSGAAHLDLGDSLLGAAGLWQLQLRPR